MNNSTNQNDYYQILGVEKSASEEQIRHAYRKLAFLYHPDRNKGNAAATEKMKEINEAYATLSDPKKRREYDALREQYGSYAYSRFRQAHSSEDIFRGSDIDQIFADFARMFGFRDSDEIFKEFYGAEYRTFEFRRPGVVGRGFIFYGPSGRAYRGEDQEVYPDQRQLPEVSSTGLLGKLARHILRKTTGIELPEKGKDWKDTITLTSRQAQEGEEIEYAYRKRGESRNLLVKIPPGIGNGQRIRLRRMGAPGKAGGEPGDLYLKFRIRIPLVLRLKKLFKLLLLGRAS